MFVLLFIDILDQLLPCQITEGCTTLQTFHLPTPPRPLHAPVWMRRLLRTRDHRSDSLSRTAPFGKGDKNMGIYYIQIYKQCRSPHNLQLLAFCLYFFKFYYQYSRHIKNSKLSMNQIEIKQ